MKLIQISMPKLDLKALLENKQGALTFQTTEPGAEPIRVEIRVREHLPLGQREPKKYGGL